MSKYIAVLQAGGKGSRMYSLTKDLIPKPLLDLNGKPMLEWQILSLKSYGITDFVIIIGHLGEMIENYFSNGEKFGVNIKYIRENEPLGSAGSLFYLKNYVENKDVIFVFGDVMLELNWDRMIKFHENKNAKITLLTHPNSHPYDSDLIVVDKNNRVANILKKSEKRDFLYDNIVNSGICIFKKDILSEIKKPEKSDFEQDIVLSFIKKGEVYSYRTSEYVKDAGIPERFSQVCIELAAEIPTKKCLKNKQKCVFIDRDGTINKYNGLIYKPSQLKLETNAAKAIKLLNSSEFLAICITNQPVAARGLCDISDIEIIHKKMCVLLGNEGAFLDDIAFCPHHPDKGYPEENPALKIECTCRKPKIGMLVEMSEKYNIDLLNSYFVGDSTVDIMTGKNAGMKTILVKTGMGGSDGKFNVSADFTAEDLLSAAEIILNNGV